MIFVKNTSRTPPIINTLTNMRKTFFTLLACLLLAACTGKAPEKGALILGEATGFDPQDSVLVFLMKYANGAGKTLVYDSVKDGKFSFRLDSLPSGIEYYMLIFTSTRNHCTAGIGPEIYLEPGTLVRIKGEGPRYANARIDSPVKDQKLRTNLRKLIPMEDWDRYADVTTHRQQMIDELRNRKDLTQEIADSLDALITKELADARASHDKIQQQVLDVFTAGKAGETGAYALGWIRDLAQTVANGKKEYREPVLRLYEKLTDEQKASADGIAILNYLNPVKTVSYGSAVPDYEYVDRNGQPVRISDFKGRWVLMDFWRKACGPCIESVPELGAVARELQEELVVVSISLDEKSTWLEASEAHGITWYDWNDPKGIFGSVRSFGLAGTPTFILVSPEGIIESMAFGYREGVLRSLVSCMRN